MKNRRKLVLGALAVVAAVNLLVGYLVFAAETKKREEDVAFEKIRIMMQVLQLIRQDYVDPKKVDYKNLIYSALEGMVSSLDPFSAFMPPDQYKEMMESTEGEFGGLGIVVTVRDGLLTIVTPIEGTPGMRAGLHAGDQIVAIDGENARGMSLFDAVKRLKGKPGTQVTITVHRPSTGETRDVTITRAVIRVPSVKDARIIDKDIGYLRITEFSEPTADRLKKTLEALQKKSRLRGIVIDLRNNPGGLLTSAVEVCSFFLPGKRLVVFTRGRRPSQKQEYFTLDEGLRITDVPIAILVNGGTASAAEIVTGCLQDYHRAVIIGERTFGKGSVQNVLELPDGSALRLTVAKYYTPSRRVIHHHGIEPDIEVALTDEEKAKLAEYQAAVGPEREKLGFRDRQLERAVEVLHSYQAFLRGRKAGFRKPAGPDKTTEKEKKEPDPAVSPSPK